VKDDIYRPIEIPEEGKESLKKAESNAKANLDGGSGRFHKNFLMFLEMAKDTFSDKRIPDDDMDKVIYGLGFLLDSYTWLKDRDPETLYYVANYSLAVHNTAWLYWEKRRCRRGALFAAESKTKKWQPYFRKRTTEIHTRNPKLSGTAINGIIIENKPKDLKPPKKDDTYEFVLSVLRELKGRKIVTPLAKRKRL
jgi:hypothetical protein